MNYMLITAMKKLQTWLQANAATAPTLIIAVNPDAASPTRYTWRTDLHQAPPDAQTTTPDFSAVGCTLQEAILNLVAAVETDA